jgi:hypothetical protein
MKIPQVPRDARITIKGVYAVLGSMRGLKKLKVVMRTIARIAP